MTRNEKFYITRHLSFSGFESFDPFPVLAFSPPCPPWRPPAVVAEWEVRLLDECTVEEAEGGSFDRCDSWYRRCSARSKASALSSSSAWSCWARARLWSHNSHQLYSRARLTRGRRLTLPSHSLRFSSHAPVNQRHFSLQPNHLPSFDSSLVQQWRTRSHYHRRPRYFPKRFVLPRRKMNRSRAWITLDRVFGNFRKRWRECEDGGRGRRDGRCGNRLRVQREGGGKGLRKERRDLCTSIESRWHSGKDWRDVLWSSDESD